MPGIACQPPWPYVAEYSYVKNYVPNGLAVQPLFRLALLLRGWVHGGTYHQLAPTFPPGWIQMTW